MVFKASAGAGKTFALVREYLYLALRERNAFRHILAITFTNKAANEMKERIIGNLRELSQQDQYPETAANSYIRPWLMEQLGWDEERLNRQAQNTLSAILHHYSDLAVMTIDSFMQRILKSFASDLNIPINFDTDTDTESLYREAVELLISRAGQDRTITTILEKYLAQHIDSDKAWDISSSLLHFFSGRLHSDENTALFTSMETFSPEDFQQIEARCHKRAKFIEATIKETANRFVALCHEHLLSEEDFLDKKRSVYTQIKKCTQGKKELFIRPDNKNIRKALEGQFTSKRANKGGEKNDIVEHLAPELTRILTHLMELTEELQPQYLLIQSILKNLYPLSLLNEINKIARQIKQEKRLVYLSDFNREISRVVQHEAVPFIYERVGEWYHHLIIDEFQDTSLLQWHNLLPLVENTLSSGKKSIIAGDAKQAIYRWRSGNAKQFSDLPALPPEFNTPFDRERAQTIRRTYNESHLKNNYRSKKEIITFNNWFFEEARRYIPPAHQKSYEHHQQCYNEENAGGAVKVQFTSFGKEDREFYTQIEEAIKEALEEGRQYREMAILVRENAFAAAIAATLTEANLPVITADSLLLKDSQKVQFILSLIRCSMEPQNRVDALNVLFFLSEQNQTLNPVTDFKRLHFSRATTNPLWRFLQGHYPALGSDLERMTLYDLTEHLISTFIPPGERDAYLRYLLNEIFNFAKQNNHKEQFFTHWENRSSKASLETSEGIDAITISSIHKAKGLEYPVVILPLAQSRFRISNEKKICPVPEIIRDLTGEVSHFYFNLEKALENTPLNEVYQEERELSITDNINILYVAMTRASQSLYLLCQMSAPPKKTAGGAFKGGISELVEKVCTTHEAYDETQQQLLILPESPPRKPHPQQETASTAPSIRILDTQNRIACNNWHHAIALSSPTLGRAVEERRSARDTGLLIHRILSRITVSEELFSAVLQEVNSGNILPKEREAITKQIIQIVTHPELAPFYQEGCTILNEREILTPEGKTYRPDRVVLSPKRAVIIDYKTGEEKPSHKAQINEYGDLLHAIGYEVTKKILVYIQPAGNPKILYS